SRHNRGMTTARQVPYDAPAVERGVGFFETVLLVGRRAVLWRPHLARLLGTLARFELPSPDEPVIEAAARAAVDSAAPAAGEERGLRIAWMAIASDLESREAWRLHVSVRPIPAATLGRRGGARAVSLPPELSRDTPTAKSTSYFAAVMGLRWAKKQGADEGLFRDREGCYSEGTSTALVAWGGGAPYHSSCAALPSVTAAAFLGGSVKVAPVRAEDVRNGALLLGSLTEVVPIVALDGEPCAVPEEMREAARAFNRRLVEDASWGIEL
ncbi:MAG TPA: aminotransferase class IV, partial [Thermoanaerobaculia bacterium]|nr:aminotransferase class IV [Thermoanaerobaculia bacterium]